MNQKNCKKLKEALKQEWEMIPTSKQEPWKKFWRVAKKHYKSLDRNSRKQALENL